MPTGDCSLSRTPSAATQAKEINQYHDFLLIVQ